MVVLEREKDGERFRESIGAWFFFSKLRDKSHIDGLLNMLVSNLSAYGMFLSTYFVLLCFHLQGTKRDLRRVRNLYLALASLPSFFL